jgi:hypothetical protein
MTFRPMKARSRRNLDRRGVEAVLDRYFEDLSVKRVERGSGWERIAELPPLFPTLVTAP